MVTQLLEKRSKLNSLEEVAIATIEAIEEGSEVIEEEEILIVDEEILMIDLKDASTAKKKVTLPVIVPSVRIY